MQARIALGGGLVYIAMHRDNPDREPRLSFTGSAVFHSRLLFSRYQRFRIEDIWSLFAPAGVWKKLECYHTLRAIPKI